jgi:hypothetical protein
MNVRPWLGWSAGIVAAAALFWSVVQPNTALSTPETPVRSGPTVSEHVRVKTDLISVDEVVLEKPRRAHTVSRPLRNTTHARPVVSLAARARKLLVGDGRYRPEPFPTPAR